MNLPKVDPHTHLAHTTTASSFATGVTDTVKTGVHIKEMKDDVDITKVNAEDSLPGKVEV
jgi:hypothetical protein